MIKASDAGSGAAESGAAESEAVRIAVLVSGGGTNLAALLEAQKSGVLRSGRIVLVISDREGAYALTRAKEAGIRAESLDKKRLREHFEEELLKLLCKERIELIVLAGFLSILSADFTARFPERILNVHPALIPSFCGKGYYGLKVHEAVLARGVTVTGATVHFVNEIPDGGRIILQKAVEVKPGDTPESLQRRVMEEAEWVILPQSVELVSKRILSGKERDERAG